MMVKNGTAGILTLARRSGMDFLGRIGGHLMCFG